MRVVQGLNNESLSKVMSDIESIEYQSWDSSMAATMEQFNKRLELFSDGLWRLIDDNNEVTAYMFFIRIKEEDAQKHYSWSDYSANGWCTNHDPNGDALFAVSIGSKKSTHGRYLFGNGIKSMEEGIYKNVKKIYACSRIPTLHNYFSNSDEVVINVDDERLSTDPVVKMLYSCDFKPYKFCKEGFDVDSESLGYSLTCLKTL
ncbi:hypothetical protein HZF24_01465 [Sedimentibacter hydroxybenzoicus DSM 7310]|uniref:Uncharacterized protein n=1 Tax=Sedimentibacter hydroxybenzoicus DSM 7310 TaxID=1123245 RepID=A0A974GV05_SEDHY|nr:hypothetical protein [Sedimentibacter hydroxybenzoicus]NYB72804.1 hypothetical protein [Sedimentibacter hydroxybenzoicus DSM 7310]